MKYSCLAASAVALWATSVGLSDAAWTAITAIAAGLVTAAATVLQAKFSADKAVQIALMKAELDDCCEEIRRLKGEPPKEGPSAQPDP